MRKVGFQGKKWDKSLFSDVMLMKYNFNTDMIFLPVILHCSDFKFGSMIWLLEAAVRLCWYLLALHIM